MASTPTNRRRRPRLARRTGAWIVYVVECADSSLYTGITTDLARRLDAHRLGRGAKYTRRRGPFVLRYSERHRTRSAALKREAAIKALRRSDKLALIGSA
ncbi:GIY-YIG nuclease family protein [Nitrospira moscoviensis]|jgi:putative endonuclease|uniref:Putative Endonuclease (Modular protein) n=1 Tax=Nitrospira moscoviensis TaxID=42253 RepID=A0A0K2GBV7_NITMO|nr:GIY-YIG nuclease family protein [Nitrospira moscoviensis]ALA58436.1 Putative Endonuclease (modular protein) [Nitrospira moscoviensis]